MQPSLPSATSSADDSATKLKRLTTMAAVIEAELRQMPDARSSGIQGFNRTFSELELDIACQLLQEKVQDFWAATGAYDISRIALLTSAMAQSLRDEVGLKIQRGEIHPDYARCVEPATSAGPVAVTFSALTVQFNEQHQVHITGALVICADDAHTLLALPGYGCEAYVSIEAMKKALVQWLNNPTLLHLLLRNTEQEYQDAVLDVDSDADLYLEPFEVADVVLHGIPHSPFESAVKAQLLKQKADISYVFQQARTHDSDVPWSLNIDRAVRMRDLFGPQVMLELLESEDSAIAERKQLPYWFKLASHSRQVRCTQMLQAYETARSALISVLEGADSPEEYASIRLHARLQNDLGYDIDPDQLKITCQRALPMTGEPYETEQSLTQMALYGLHPGDLTENSELLTHSNCTLHGQSINADYPRLTARYVVNLIDSLDLRASFGTYQYDTFKRPGTQKLMSHALDQQLQAQACVADLQGHIQPADFALIEAVARGNAIANGASVQLQQLILNNDATLGNALLLRKLDAEDKVERLLLFTPDIPGEHIFRAFDNETRLQQELVSWSTSAALSEYLLEHVPPVAREGLRARLLELREKPQPESDFLTFVTCDSYAAALQAQALLQIQSKQARQALHTPDWFLRSSVEERRKLTSLEHAIVGAQKNYEAQPHTKVVEFEAYVHQHASTRIARLLGTSVDPDEIIVTTPRETLTYTKMLRDGYDDTLGLLNATADTSATFTGPAGIDLTPLTPQKVAGSVRGSWLSDGYVALIKSTLLDPQGEGYAYRRRHSLLITQLQMAATALRSKMKGEILPSHYAWLHQSIDWMHLDDAKSRLHSGVYPLQFKIENPLVASGLPELDKALDILKDVVSVFTPARVPDVTVIETVQGCLLLTPPGSKKAADTLLYTPGAPDGVEWRRLDQFLQTLKGEGMSDYYKDRCRLKANRTLAFFLADMKNGGDSPLPVLPATAHADLQEVCFDRKLLRKIRDVEETTTGRSDMISKVVWDSIEIISAAVTLPFPIASFIVGATFALHYSNKAFDAFKEGDQAAASGYILGALLNSLGAAGDLHSGLKGFGGIVRELSHSPANPLLKATPTLRRWSALPELQTLEVNGEKFWIKAADHSSVTPLFRASHENADRLVPSGSFAELDTAGHWRPLLNDTSAALPASRVQANPQFAVKLSLDSTPTASRGYANGVSFFEGKHYITLDDKVYQVSYDARMAHWSIIDPANPFAFFGKQPVALDAKGQWQILDAMKLRGGMPDRYGPLAEVAAPPPTAARSIQDYELPRDLQPYTFSLVVPRELRTERLDLYGLDLMLEDFFTRGRQTYATLRESLYRDAKAFFDQPTLAAKPNLPDIVDTATASTFVEQALASNPGLVISENVGSLASKKFLIDNMVEFAKNKVEVLYIEHLFTDLHIKKLYKYQQRGSKTKGGSHSIRYHLKEINDGALYNGSEVYDYYHVIKAAHRHGIEVKPMNSTVSYNFAHNPVATAAGDEMASRNMSVFMGNKIISEDVAENASRRWVALLHTDLANTHRQVPGISELQGATSARVVDVTGNQPLLISRDVDSAVEIKADFKIELAHRPARTPTPPITTAEYTAPAARNVLDDKLHALLKGQSNFTITTHPVTEMSFRVRTSNATPYADVGGFKLDHNGRWQTVSAAVWDQPRAPDALQLSLIDPKYQVPMAERALLHEVANFEDKPFVDALFSASVPRQAAREQFFTLRKSLQRDARAVISGDFPARPVMPDIPAHTSNRDFLDALYQHTNGVVVGEAHFSSASKKFILDNLEHLHESGVRTLYMEHLLTDLHQAQLDRFAEDGLMGKRLLHDLKQLDRDWRTDPRGVYTFERLVTKAREHNIEVRAIDCAASYFQEGLNTASDTTRQQMMNFFASRTIRTHQEVIGQGKWIALVGSSHTNMYQKIVPGVAELEQGIGVRVMDVGPGEARGPIRDPGQRMAQEDSLEDVLVQADFLLDLETRSLPQSPLIGTSMSRGMARIAKRKRLTMPGKYLIEEYEPGRLTIWHHSNDTQVYETPISYTAEGKLYLQRPNWGDVHGKRFDNLDQLTAALAAMNLDRVV